MKAKYIYMEKTDRARFIESCKSAVKSGDSDFMEKNFKKLFFEFMLFRALYSNEKLWHGAVVEERDKLEKANSQL